MRAIKPITFAGALLAALSLTLPAHASEETLTPVRALEQQRLLMSHASQLRAARPKWAQKVDSAPLYRSRTGSSVFYGPDIADAQAATLLVDRASQHPDPAFRRAVAEALPSTGSHELGALIASQLPIEPDPEVRQALAHALRYASDAPAASALRLAARDERPEVRVIALRSMRQHDQLALFAGQIRASMQDPEPAVQEAALLAWGTLRDPDLKIDIAPFLQSERSQLRLAALRAQFRVAQNSARDWVERLELDQDPEPKVARLAQRILNR